MSKDELTRRSGLSQQAESKPVLMQLLETFLAGGSSGAQAPAPAAGKQSPSPVQSRVEPVPAQPLSQAQPPKRKEEVAHKRDSPSPDFFSGDKLKSANAGNKKSERERHLEIASQMLEEQSQEERSGFRAEIPHKSSSVSDQKSPSPVAPPSRQNNIGKEKSNEFADNYNDDFDEEEIVEDIPADGVFHDDTDNLLGSANNYGERPPHRSTIITESAGGITVSQSLGVDPSVDSLALEDYDHIEPVERVSY